MVETIDQVDYAVTDLSKRYGAKKDWKKIEAEDTSTYRRLMERYPITTSTTTLLLPYRTLSGFFYPGHDYRLEDNV